SLGRSGRRILLNYRRRLKVGGSGRAAHLLAQLIELLVDLGAVGVHGAEGLFILGDPAAEVVLELVDTTVGGGEGAGEGGDFLPQLVDLGGGTEGAGADTGNALVGLGGLFFRGFHRLLE